MIELQPEGVLFVRPFLAVTAGILVLLAGKAINQRVQGLREANIPEPVTGGLLFALSAWLIYLVSGYQVIFELHSRDVLLVYFFVTIGINARVADLKEGGRPLAILLTAVAVFIVLQDVLGIVGRGAARPADGDGRSRGQHLDVRRPRHRSGMGSGFRRESRIPNGLEMGVSGRHGWASCSRASRAARSHGFSIDRHGSNRRRRRARSRRPLRRRPARYRLLLVSPRDFWRST